MMYSFFIAEKEVKTVIGYSMAAKETENIGIEILDRTGETVIEIIETIQALNGIVVEMLTAGIGLPSIKEGIIKMA